MIRLGLLVLAQVAPAAKPAARPPADRVAVPGGIVHVGSNKGEDDERPLRKVAVPAFAIDRTEVTQAAYARCVEAKRCAAPPEPWALRIEGMRDGLPVVGVSWFDARDYCLWAGGRLPTEDEWEKAARGIDARDYPWGGGADCGRGNWGNFDGEGPCASRNPGKPTPVGSYPQGASPYGALNLGGNVWEWTLGRYPFELGRRVVRGGSCCSYFVGPRTSNRNAWAPAHRDGDLGFRCVARPAPAPAPGVPKRER